MKNYKARDTASTASLRPRAVNYELSKAIDIVYIYPVHMEQ